MTVSEYESKRKEILEMGISKREKAVRLRCLMIAWSAEEKVKNDLI